VIMQCNTYTLKPSTGGSRVPIWRSAVNVFVVFTFVAAWHDR
jgi:hypothetical protein